jgi:hypothetical protein
MMRLGSNASSARLWRNIVIFDTIFVMLAVAAAGVLADDVKVIDVACGGHTGTLVPAAGLWCLSLVQNSGIELARP